MAGQSVGGAATIRKSATAEIRVKPINGFIGAEIEGVDLRRPLSPRSSRSSTTRWSNTK